MRVSFICIGQGRLVGIASRVRAAGFVALVIATAAWVGVGGCSSARFYVQAVVGQTSLMLARRDAEAVIADPTTDPEVATKLRLTARLLRFAETELQLPVGDRYQSYVAVSGPPLWNVVAAPEFDVAAMPRCYPVVGCAVYRGYFSRRAAEREAARLAVAYDVHIGAVAAYSTLGWFDDPILQSFLRYDEPSLANLIFHELAHSIVYVEGDSAFNESFASFVGSHGAVPWLEREGGDAVDYLATLAAEREFNGFLRAWRDRLARLYQQPISDPAKRQLKAATLDGMLDCYSRHRARLGDGRYDATMARPFNNARLALTATYDSLRPGFQRLFEQVEGDWLAFYAAVRDLAELPRATRHRDLRGDQSPAGMTGCLSDQPVAKQ